MVTDTTPSEPEQTKGRTFRRLLMPTWQERKRALRTEAWVFVVGSYVLVAYAFLFPQDFRNAAPLYVAAGLTAFMVRTFLFHIGLVLLAIAMVAAARRCRRLALATLPLLLVALGPELWEYRPKSPPEIRGEAITVMSVNLLMVNRSTDGIIEEIERAAPDLLLLQEYTVHWHAAMREALGTSYPHIACVPRADSFGVAVYSRRPFSGPVAKSVPLADASVPQMRAVVEIAGRDVAVYNVHLLPPRRLDYTTVTRLQFADLLDRVNDESLPVIVAGDFNFTQRSPQAAALGRNGMRDAHSLGGWGRGTTWPVNTFFRWVPNLRLDHIYVSGALTATGCRTGEGEGSDHRPVMADVGFR